MPAIINSDSGIITGSAGLKIHGNSDGILEIQNNGASSLIVANSYVRVPVGNTATRPTVASAGMLRFNNNLNSFEIFASNGWVSVTPPVSNAIAAVEYLVVAGGGGAGVSLPNTAGGGGGGAGGYRTSFGISGGGAAAEYAIVIESQTNYIITVGAGGAGANGTTNVIGANGSPSVFSTIQSEGGGAGGLLAPGAPNHTAQIGGSGGGKGGSGASPYVAFSAGVPGIPNQGYAGGGMNSGGRTRSGGGGGGAGSVGEDASVDTVGGSGGTGVPSLITGSNVFYAGGGGGGGSAAGGSGGAGGGGSGGGPLPGLSGNVNTGGGGGGSSGPGFNGGSGGSGVVILSHANTISNAVVSAGLSYTLNTESRPGFLVYTFTAGTGNIYWA